VPDAASSILLLDDDPGVLLLQRRSLERAGYAVSGVSHADDALALLGARSFDLLVLDYRLGAAETGLDFYRRLRGMGIDRPAILVTAFSDESRAIDALRAGVRDVVPKAGDYLAYLPEAAARVLRQVRAERELAETEMLRRSQAALRESVEKFQTLADNIAQLAWMADGAGSIFWYNKRWFDYTGTTPEGMEREGWRAVIHPEHADRVLEKIARCFREGEAWEDTFPLRGRGGDYGWFLSRAAPIRNAEGGVARWFGTSTDVTDQRRLLEEREALLESERAARAEAERNARLKDEFLATLSHELRTPLNAIVGWSKLLTSRPPDPETLAKGLDVIARNARAQSQLIDDLLDMSRIVSGKLRLEMRAVDIAGVVEGALESVGPTAEAKGVALEREVEPRAGLVLGDPDRLQQVLWNLLSNAVKFTPPGGRVRVAARRSGSSVEVSVSDTGEGIRPEFLAQIFERFRQADASAARRHAGLGLGLSIVRSLVELHGGSVSASSEGEGHGATFTVRLPRTAPGEAADDGFVPPAEAGDALDLTGLRVVLVEDEEDSRDLLRRVLEGSGAQALPAASADEGLEAVRRHRPDVLLSDIGMPGQDGYDLIRRVRALPEAEGGSTPAAALTAFARPADRERALAAGFQAHLAKPVNAAAVLALVAALAGRTSAAPGPKP